MSDKKRKVGALSSEEMLFIQGNHEKMSAAEIAEYLGRTPGVIEKFLKTKLLAGEPEENLAIRARLHTKPFYQSLVETLSAKELETFEATWVGIMLQFSQNVLATEELQIKQWITLELLMNRSMADRKAYIDECERIQKDIDRERKLADSGDPDAAEKVALLEQQLSMVRSAISAYATEHTKYLEKVTAITKDLKGTRDQRLKRIEDGKITWPGLIKDLDDEERRREEGREMELVRKAMEKAKEQLMGEHMYEDKKFDRPLLNSESVTREEPKDEPEADIL